ncbi:2-hydroxyacid dehydrogenase [bacterium]|nr:2-hydroxyacid dehydrogenase [bacterium]
MKKTERVLFYDAKPYDREYFDRHNREKYRFEIKYFPGHLNRDTAGLAAGYAVVCVFVNDQVDQPVIQTLKKQGVKLIALRSAGYNHVDLKAAFGNIHVVRVPGYSPYAVAEHAVGLMLCLDRKLHKAYNRTRDGNFSLDGLLGSGMHGKTAGVIGTGKIGRCLISILKGFGMDVLAHDKMPDRKYADQSGIRFTDLETIYAQSDIISLNCPLTPETQHMINEKSIAGMKDRVMIINTGRGKLIKTEALISGLKSGKIGAAGLDVYEEESEYFFEDFSNSMIGDDILARLLTFPNVLITSHQAFFTREALSNIAETTLENIQEYSEGGYLKNEVCYQCEADCKKESKQRCFELDG